MEEQRNEGEVLGGVGSPEESHSEQRKYLFPKEGIGVLFALIDYKEDSDKRGGGLQARITMWDFIRLMVPETKDSSVNWSLKLGEASDGIVYVVAEKKPTDESPSFDNMLQRIFR